MGISMLVIIFAVLVAILFMIFKMVFKVASNFKVFGLAIVVTCLLGIIGFVILYINGIDYNLLGKSNKYISGQVVKVESNQITVRVIEHNLDVKDLVNKNITIKINSDTVVKRQERALFESHCEFFDISRGHRVNINCYYKNSIIMAQKIVIKY